MELKATLPSEERSAFTARRCVDAVAPFLASEKAEELRVLVNELVTNSIVHSGSERWISLEIKVLPGQRVRADVRDAGNGFVPRVPDRVDGDGDSGRGLYLVEHLADAWGMHMDGHTNVWFELDLQRLQTPGL